MIKKISNTVLLTIILFTFNLAIGYGQGYTISGQIINRESKAIEYATIALFTSKDSVFVKAELSDTNGNFEFSTVNNGSYFLKISQLGYTDLITDRIEVNSAPFLFTNKSLLMSEKSEVLKDVTIVAEKPFVTREADKLVVNVENSIVSSGSTLLEVLQRSPGVMVNQETSINLKGKAGVTVMIDGKISPLSGADLINYLKGIPAANIKSVEIITNPSAKYDAAGNAGIINIRFKKGQNEGLNGNLNVNFGQGIYEKVSASTSLNYRNDKFNVFGSYSYSTPKNLTKFDIKRNFFDSERSVISSFDQKSVTVQPFMSNNVRFGVDYKINNKAIIGFMSNINANQNVRNGNNFTIIDDIKGDSDYTTNSKIAMQGKRLNGFSNINFKLNIDSIGSEFSIDLDYGSYNAKTFQQIHNVNNNSQQQLLSQEMLDTDQRGLISVSSIKSDYTSIITPKFKVDFGAKFSVVKTNNDVKFFIINNQVAALDTFRSNEFKYKENINAAYTSAQFSLGVYDIQLGLRAEHTNTKGEQITTGENFNRNYIYLFPNLSITRIFSEINQWNFAYSRRIDRPSYNQLNPFRIFVDPYTYVVGDPALNPVLTDNFEINHTYRGKYITTLTMSRSKSTITDIFVQDDDTKISYQVPANIQDFVQASLGIYLPIKVNKSINSTFSGSGYWSKYSSPLLGGILVNQFYAYDLNINNNLTFGRNWAGEINGFYQSKNVWGQFIIKNLAQVSVGISKTTNNKNTTFKFAISDIFTTNRIAVIVDYLNQDFVTNRTWDSRVASLNISHRFGKKSVQRSRQRNSGIEDEKSRAN